MAEFPRGHQLKSFKQERFLQGAAELAGSADPSSVLHLQQNATVRTRRLALSQGLRHPSSKGVDFRLGQA